MTSQYIAGSKETEIKGIIFVGFPLHASGKPSIERAEHLEKIERKYGNKQSFLVPLLSVFYFG